MLARAYWDLGAWEQSVAAAQEAIALNDSIADGPSVEGRRAPAPGGRRTAGR